MSNFMKVSQSRRKHPPFVSGRLAFSFALGLMAFAPSPVLANVDANTSMSVQQQKQSINGVVKYLLSRNCSKIQIIKVKVQCSKFKGNCSKDKKKEHSLEYSFCDSDRIQTCNLLIRSQVLYSVELRNHYYGRTDNDLVIISELRVQRYCFLSVPPNV